jgi:hypothetical protein
VGAAPRPSVHLYSEGNIIFVAGLRSWLGLSSHQGNRLLACLIKCYKLQYDDHNPRPKFG